MGDELFSKALTEAYQRDTRGMHEQIDELVVEKNALHARCVALEQVVRNYHTAIDAMPDHAMASDYKRVLAPVQEMAQALLEQEKTT